MGRHFTVQRTSPSCVPDLLWRIFSFWGIPLVKCRCQVKSQVFTARRHDSALYAVVVRLSVCLSQVDVLLKRLNVSSWRKQRKTTHKFIPLSVHLCLQHVCHDAARVARFRYRQLILVSTVVIARLMFVLCQNKVTRLSRHYSPGCSFFLSTKYVTADTAYGIHLTRGAKWKGYEKVAICYKEATTSRKPCKTEKKFSKPLIGSHT